MKTLNLVLASMLFCGASQAASIVCTGEKANYAFTLSAKLSGESVVGPVSAVITKNRKPHKKGTAVISYSDYSPSQLNVIAKDKNVQFTLMSVRVNGGGYKGMITIDDNGAKTEVSTTCQVR